jgi:hypothetical protein
MFQALLNGILVRFKSTTTGSGDTLEHTKHEIVDNLGALSANLPDDVEALAVNRTQVVAALRLLDTTLNGGAGGMVRARGTVANGLAADVTRMPAAHTNAQAAILAVLEQIRDQQAITQMIIETYGFADTAQHVLPDVPCKMQIVHIVLPVNFVGSLSVTDANGGTDVLSWDATDARRHRSEGVFYAANFNQIRVTQSTANQTFTVKSAN